MSLVATAEASSAQARMWFLDGMLPDGMSYHVTRAIELRGELLVEPLREAIGDCARRHEVLRTCFRLVDGRLMQIITSELPQLRIVDLRGLPADVSRLVGEAAVDPFNLKRAPLFRVHLLRLEDDRHVLIFVFHHIVVDAWSLDLVIREVADRYLVHVSGDAQELPAPRLQYADYAHWQRRMVEGGGADDDLGYWLEQTKDLPRLELFTDRPRVTAPPGRYGLLEFSLAPDLVRRLERLARQEDATLFMVLLAGFTVLLHRCTGQDDIVLGGTTPARHRPELQGMIGFFVNMLVHRVRLTGATTLREVLRRTTTTCQDAYDHQEAPFERLVDLQGGRRSAGRHPFFDIIFQMITVQTDLSLPGLEARFLATEPGPAMFDLAITVEPGGGYVEYSPGLYDHETIAGLTEAWIRVLQELADDPDRPLDGPLPASIQRDRRPDLEPQADGSASQTDGGPPSGVIEEAIAEIWRSTLSQPDIGREADFFALGGHSLLATVLLTAIQERSGVEISLEEFFRKPTIAATAAAVARDTLLEEPA